MILVFALHTLDEVGHIKGRMTSHQKVCIPCAHLPLTVEDMLYGDVPGGGPHLAHNPMGAPSLGQHELIPLGDLKALEIHSSEIKKSITANI